MQETPKFSIQISAKQAQDLLKIYTEKSAELHKELSYNERVYSRLTRGSLADSMDNFQKIENNVGKKLKLNAQIKEIKTIIEQLRVILNSENDNL